MQIKAPGRTGSRLRLFTTVSPNEAGEFTAQISPAWNQHLLIQQLHKWELSEQLKETSSDPSQGSRNRPQHSGEPHSGPGIGAKFAVFLNP